MWFTWMNVWKRVNGTLKLLILETSIYLIRGFFILRFGIIEDEVSPKQFSVKIAYSKLAPCIFLLFVFVLFFCWFFLFFFVFCLALVFSSGGDWGTSTSPQLWLISLLFCPKNRYFFAMFIQFLVILVKTCLPSPRKP